MNLEPALTVLMILIIVLAVLPLLGLIKLLAKRMFRIDLGDDLVLKLFKLYGFDATLIDEKKPDAIFDAIQDTYTHAENVVTTDQLITTLARRKLLSPENQAKLLEAIRKNRMDNK